MAVKKSERTPAQRALYNNLNQDTELAVKVHESIIEYKPDGWRGVGTREKEVKRAIYNVLKSEAETERIFKIVQEQGEY